MNLDEIDLELAAIAAETEKEVSLMTEPEALGKIWEVNRTLTEIFEERIIRMEVAGNIGVGKTTLANLIALHGGGIPTLLEPVDENEMLNRYYADKKVYGERFQVHAMNDRARRYLFQLKMFPETSFISDRTRAEDVDSFCAALHRLKFLTDESYEFCQWYFDWHNGKLEEEYAIALKPDFVFFLKPSRKRDEDQTENRDRKLELGEDAKVKEFRILHRTLHEEYEEHFVRRLRKHYEVPVLTIAPQDERVLDATKASGQYYLVKTATESLKRVYDQ